MIRRRPTETLTGLGLAAAIYGFLTEATLDKPLAAIIAVAVAFVPAAISEIVDAVRGDQLQVGDHTAEIGIVE